MLETLEQICKKANLVVVMTGERRSSLDDTLYTEVKIIYNVFPLWAIGLG